MRQPDGQYQPATILKLTDQSTYTVGESLGCVGGAGVEWGGAGVEWGGAGVEWEGAGVECGRCWCGVWEVLVWSREVLV